MIEIVGAAEDGVEEEVEPVPFEPVLEPVSPTHPVCDRHANSSAVSAAFPQLPNAVRCDCFSIPMFTARLRVECRAGAARQTGIRQSQTFEAQSSSVLNTVGGVHRALEGSASYTGTVRRGAKSTLLDVSAEEVQECPAQRALRWSVNPAASTSLLLEKRRPSVPAGLSERWIYWRWF